MPRPRQLLRTATLACVCTLAANGTRIPAFQQATKPPAPQTGLIAGRVLDSRNAPVEDAIVVLRGPQVAGQQEILRRVVVDAQGRFVFSELPAGRYEIVADQFGYLRGEYGKLTPAGVRTRLELTENQRLTDATVQMWKYASISGRVVDDAGEPVASVSVRALRRSWRQGQPALTQVRSGTTDDRGIYRIAMLPPGEYAIAVPARTSTFPVDTIRTALTSFLNLGVAETARLGDHRYVQMGEHVLATMHSAPIPPAPRNGRLTVFETTFYPAGVTAEEAQVLALDAGEDRSAIDVKLQASATSRVSGRINGPDGPLGLLPFRVLRAGSSTVAETPDFEAATGLTSIDGRFVLLGLPRGQFVIRVATSPENMGNQPAGTPSLTANERFAVNDSDIADLVVMARNQTVIRGTVDIQAPAEAPQNFDVVIQAFDGSPGLRVFNPRVGSDRRFTAEVPPGRYLVLTYDRNGVPCVSTAAGRVVSDTLLDIGTQPTIDIAMTCTGVTTEVSGTVQDRAGKPNPQARVMVFPVDRARWSGEGYAPRRSQSVRTTSQGTFSIRHLPAGDYLVVAVAEAAGVDAEDPEVRSRLSQSATRLSLASGTKRSVDLRTVTTR